MNKTILTQAEILDMDKQYRTNLINSLPGIRAANLIGTIDSSGKTNVAIFNSVVHIGAHPPLMGFIMRPVSVQRDTYQNIKETGSFTINHVTERFYKEAHQTSARHLQSEFQATGLTEEYSLQFAAPYVAESPVKIGLKWVEELPIKSNETILIIGEIVEVKLDTQMLTAQGILQLNETGSIGVNGLETYYAVAKIAELPYAKP
jgi:flavin reductase (DIM6/NTAB) family NADH-FMN oxidoreductase RutF